MRKRLEQRGVRLQAWPNWGVERHQAEIMAHLTQRNGLRPGSGRLNFHTQSRWYSLDFVGISIEGPSQGRSIWLR